MVQGYSVCESVFFSLYCFFFCGVVLVLIGVKGVVDDSTNNRFGNFTKNLMGKL